MAVAGLEGIDASSMEVIDALGGTRFTYDVEERIARPLLRHTDFVPVAVNREGARVVEKGRFGMPGFEGRIVTNARMEGLRETRAWMKLFGDPAHHSLTAISYVVEREKKTGATYRIQRKDGKLIVVTGLAAVRHYAFASTGNEYDDLGHVQITAPANAFVATVHDRFVCELATKEDRDRWMRADGGDGNGLMELLRPAPEDGYEMVPIAPDVWKRRDDPDAARPIGQSSSPATQRRLF